MKLFLDEEEKSQLRRLRQLEKAGVRRMTQDEPLSECILID